jgi:hypothetical protein
VSDKDKDAAVVFRPFHEINEFPGEPPEAVIVQIGEKGELTRVLARDAAEAMVTAREAYPEATLTLTVDGFDADPREIWDIPEARAYVRDFAGFAALIRPGVPLQAWKLDPGSLALILVCTGRGRITGRDPITGGYLVESNQQRRDAT